MDRSICPHCSSDDTYCDQDWLGKELMHCDNCNKNYAVIYDLKIKEIKKC
jgi:hypothetical protein